MIQRLLFSLVAVSMALAAGCRKTEEPAPARAEARPVISIATTAPPLRLILEPLAKGRAEVFSLIPPSASPHTWEPTPRSVARVTEAGAIFFVSVGFDGWAASIPGIAPIAVLDMVPAGMALEEACDHGHDHGHHHHHARDPHFWMDPVVVRAIVPSLVRSLSDIDPEGAATYARNGEEFMARLDALHDKLQADLAPLRGRRAFVHHRAYDYLFHRYGLEVGGVVMEAPEAEASPRQLAALVEALRAEPVRVVFTEPQLPRSAAVSLAREVDGGLYTLDPIGGAEGRETYEALILYNAHQLVAALSLPGTR